MRLSKLIEILQYYENKYNPKIFDPKVKIRVEEGFKDLDLINDSAETFSTDGKDNVYITLFTFDEEEYWKEQEIQEEPKNWFLRKLNWLKDFKYY